MKVMDMGELRETIGRVREIIRQSPTRSHAEGPEDVGALMVMALCLYQSIPLQDIPKTLVGALTHLDDVKLPLLRAAPRDH